MVYLQYRLERAGIKNLESVYIKKTDKELIYKQISDEMQFLFPEAKIELLTNDIQEIQNCDLVIIPCELLAIRKVFSRFKECDFLPSRNTMFYDVYNRRIEIFERKRWKRWFLGKLMEKVFVITVQKIRHLSKL